LTLSETKSFPVLKTTGGIYILQRSKICLNQKGFFLQSFQMKTEKRKGKRSKKIRKAAGQHFGPRMKPAHGPGEQSRTGTLSSPSPR
jgi:hypothetical protein